MDKQSIYDEIELYDLAFSYRDFKAETEFLLAAYARATDRKSLPTSVLEIASGTGRHALAFADRGVRAIGVLDSASAMISSACALFRDRGLDLEAIEADMRDFRVSHRYDLSICMLDSLSHIVEESDLVRHFQAVRNALAPGGVYIAELAWPAAEGEDSRTHDHWTIENAHLCLDVAWGDHSEFLDARRRISRIPVRFEARPKNGGIPTVVTDTYVGREWTFEAVTEAIVAAGGLRVADIYTGFDLSTRYVPGTTRGWRMIMVAIRDEGLPLA